MSGGSARPNVWIDATISKLTPIRSGSPIAFFDVQFALLEAVIVGCTLRRTKAGKLWCSPPKLRRQLPDGTTQYDDVVEWDGGGAASQFSSACLEAIAAHSPELLRPQLEGHAVPPPLALPQQQRTRPAVAPPHAPDRWERDR